MVNWTAGDSGKREALFRNVCCGEKCAALCRAKPPLSVKSKDDKQRHLYGKDRQSSASAGEYSV